MTTRRRFLGGAAALAGAALLPAGCGGPRHGRPGPLTDRELDTLAAAALVLLDSPRAPGTRYRELLAWRARRFPVEGRVLSELAARLDEATASGSFVAAVPAARRRALDPALDRRSGVPFRLRVQADPSGPDRFERYFVLPVVALYARTDAWLDVGYGDHPGMPRDPRSAPPAPAPAGGGRGAVDTP